MFLLLRGDVGYPLGPFLPTDEWLEKLLRVRTVLQLGISKLLSDGTLK